MKGVFGSIQLTASVSSYILIDGDFNAAAGDLDR